MHCFIQFHSDNGLENMCSTSSSRITQILLWLPPHDYFITMVTCVHALFDYIWTTISMSYWLSSRFTVICYIVKRCEVWCLVGIHYLCSTHAASTSRNAKIYLESMSPPRKVQNTCWAHTSRRAHCTNFLTLSQLYLIYLLHQSCGVHPLTR